MADNWVDTISGELRSWADEHDADVDVRDIGLLLDLARDDLKLAGPGALTPDLLRELMLDVVPEAVVAGPDEAPALLDAARHLLAFLRDTGAVKPGAATRLEAALDRLVPQFTKVIATVDEEDRLAAAEILTGMMLAEGVPLDDEDAVARWIGDFEALPDDERYARTDEYLRESEDRAVPPVRLAADAELAAAARGSGLTAQVRALTAWVGEGRAVTEHEDLPVADALAAVEALDLPSPRRTATVESQEDLPELDRLWWAALDAEMFAIADGTVSPGPAADLLDGAGGDAGDDAALDEAALDAWLRLFDGVAVPEHDPADGLDPLQLIQNELTGVLIQLYEQDAPTSLDELSGALIEHVTEAYEVTERHGLADAIREALALEIEDLVRWGVVVPGGDGGGHVLTPLGTWGVRELLLADGFVAPVVGDLADAPAAALVAGLTWHRQETADEEIDGWLARRDALPAARELLEVMRTGGPGARNLAAAVLQRVGPEAEPAVREASGDRPVRPYAVLWLDRLEDEDAVAASLDRDEYLWLFVDTVAGMLETVDPDEAVAAAVTDAPTGSDLAGMIEQMWRVDHPAAHAVLEALGDHHPDKAIAKAARTAAYKARSA
ncbi:hypothetical protein [Actinomadura sp. 9N407]|uniref:hypothetical protein n=1 Tax=Actinomadura sp. 9N407 TaxID=3375154 RepID=UPI00379CA7B9